MKKKQVLVCGHVEEGYPALSQYGHGDICSPCGMREAFEGDFIGTQKLIEDELGLNPMPEHE